LADDPFVTKWLRDEQSAHHPKGFHTRRLSELPDTRSAAEGHLARTCVRHLRRPGVLRRLGVAGFPHTAAALADVPDDIRYRHGIFGEILAAEYMIQVEGHVVPVYRLQYRTHPYHSMPGEDVIALESLDGRDRLRVAEAKTRQEYRGAMVTDACSQIRATGAKPRPESLSFILDRLDEQGKHELFDRVLGLVDPAGSGEPARSYLIFLVTGDRPLDPFAEVDDGATKTGPLTVVSLHLPDLAAFVKSVLETEVNVDEI
jgi:hypothetical protein